MAQGSPRSPMWSVQLSPQSLPRGLLGGAEAGLRLPQRSSQGQDATPQQGRGCGRASPSLRGFLRLAKAERASGRDAAALEVWFRGDRRRRRRGISGSPWSTEDTEGSSGCLLQVGPAPRPMSSQC